MGQVLYKTAAPCSGAPPTIVFLGTEDPLIPVATGKAFQDVIYRETVAAMDDFLCSLGWC